MLGKRFLLLFSVLSILLLFLFPLSACGGVSAQTTASVTPTIPPGPTPPPPLISKVLGPSTSSQSLSVEGQVTVTIPGGLLDNSQNLAIAPDAALPSQSFQGIAEMAGYTITLGNLQQLSKPINIDITYDPTKLPTDLTPDQALMASFWDTTQNLWVGVPTTVDTTNHMVRIQSDHLTAWKVYYVMQGYGVKDDSHFLVMYDKHPTIYPIIDKVQIDPAVFATNVLNYLDHAYDAYDAANFTMPTGQMRAFIDANVDMPERSGRTGFMYFATSYGPNGDRTLKQETAHELFHCVQNKYFNVYGMGFRAWWMEATADYAAYQVAWGGAGELSPLGHSYFDKSITVMDSKHEYQTANFVKFLVGNGMDFKGAWDAVANDGSINVLSPLEAYVLSKTGKTLQDNYAAFMRYTLYDSGTPMDPLDKELLYAGVIDHVDVLTPDLHSASYTFNLGADYTANVWGLAIQTTGSTTNRSLHLQVSGTAPAANQVRADVVVLKGDLQTPGGAPLTGTLDATHTTLDVNVSKGDALYISASNSGASSQQLTIKLTEGVAMTISPDSVTLPPKGVRVFTAGIPSTAPAGSRAVWTINEGAAGGTIDSVGLYTAPSTTGTYHVTATLSTDKTKTATATVSVSLVAVKLNIDTVTMSPGAKQAFLADVTGNPDTRVTWRVIESGGGIITTDGVYTAPSAPGTYHVAATSIADETVSARATISVVATTTIPTSTTPSSGLTVSPSHVVLIPGATQVFNASLTGLSDTRVDWGGPSLSSSNRQAANIPVTFTAGDLGNYTITVTSVADPTQTAQATVQVVPGVWVLVSTKTTSFPAFPSGVTPVGAVNFSAGSAAVTNTYGTVSSNWNFSWTVPPERLAPGDKFVATMTAKDTGSVYDPKQAHVFPKGSVDFNLEMAYITQQSTSVVAGGQPFVPTASQSYTYTVPAGTMNGPQLDFRVYVKAEADLAGDNNYAQMVGYVTYTYELRPQ